MAIPGSTKMINPKNSIQSHSSQPNAKDSAQTHTIRSPNIEDLVNAREYLVTAIPLQFSADIHIM